MVSRLKTGLPWLYSNKSEFKSKILPGSILCINGVLHDPKNKE
jgi:hypothetical protein